MNDVVPYGVLLMFVILMMGMFGTFILLPIYMQNVRGLDTLQTGLMLLPGSLLMGLLGPRVGRLYDRLGPTPLVVPGTILVCAVLWAMTLLGPRTGARRPETRGPRETGW